MFENGILFDLITKSKRLSKFVEDVNFFFLNVILQASGLIKADNFLSKLCGSNLKTAIMNDDWKVHDNFA